MALKLKTVTIEGKTYAEVNDNKPVFVHDDGKELPFDADGALSRIGALNAEAKSHREKWQQYEPIVKKFEGIDPDKARNALETIANLDEGKLLTADKVAEIKAAAKRTAEEAIAEATKSSNELRTKAEKERDEAILHLNGYMIGNSFANSKFIKERTILPPDLMQKSFGHHFKVEDGKPVAYESDGVTKIYSRINHGNPADVEEALEILVDRYPNRDAILKGTGGGGGGRGANGGNGGGGKTITRREFDAMDAQTRASRIAEKYTIVD